LINNGTLRGLPISPGVYLFKNKQGEILYIGKAASLKVRVGSYFSPSRSKDRLIEKMIELVEGVEIQEAATTMEAYFLEQRLIKELQPRYNVLGRDDKSFVYLALTKENFPQWEVIRQTDLTEAKKEGKFAKFYGPFDSKRTVTEILKFLRKIFPFHNRPGKTEKGCLDFQIGLCPGPYAGAISQKDYQKNIRAIELIVQGKRVRLEQKLEKEMEQLAQDQQFERAIRKRDQLQRLRKIQRLILISRERPQVDYQADSLKIEGYDISHLSGKFTVGSLVSFSFKSGRLRVRKANYRRFKIRSGSAGDDLKALREVLTRRLKRADEWPLPDLFLIDGGETQLKVVEKVLGKKELNVPILAVAKGPERKNLDLRLANLDLQGPQHRALGVFLGDQRSIGRVRDEAHRFAISYHRKIREKSLDVEDLEIR